MPNKTLVMKLRKIQSTWRRSSQTRWPPSWSGKRSGLDTVSSRAAYSWMHRDRVSKLEHSIPRGTLDWFLMTLGCAAVRLLSASLSENQGWWPYLTQRLLQGLGASTWGRHNSSKCFLFVYLKSFGNCLSLPSRLVNTLMSKAFPISTTLPQNKKACE